MFLRRLLSLNRTLAFRLTIWYAGLFSAIFFFAALVSYFMIASMIRENTDRDLFNEAREFSSIYRTKGENELKAAMGLEVESEGIDNMFLRLVGADNRVFSTDNLSKWGDIGLGRISRDNITRGTGYVYETLAVPGRPYDTRILTYVMAPGKILQIGKSMEHNDRMEETFRKIFGITFLVILALTAPAGYLIARKALAGVEEVTRAANKISMGYLDHRVNVTGHGEEIQHLSTAFNQMAEKIQDLIKGMREMTDNIAHDLRSPITRIRGVAETALISDQPGSDDEGIAGSVVEECDRLLGMINTMLDISEAEAGVMKLNLEDIDLVQVVGDACDLFQPVAEDNHVRVIQELPPNAFIQGEAIKIQRVVSNLLDNALKFTPEGGSVTVSLHGNESWVTLDVKDTGPGISTRDLPRIFDRFYRGDQSRPRGGTGLGLTLARAICRAHGGNIEVKSVPGKGSDFTMTLPRSSSLP